jgi:hypothetical protein
MQLTKAEEVSYSSALFTRCRARTSLTEVPIMPRVVIPRSVRSTVSRYVFEKTFGRVRDVRVREKQASFCRRTLAAFRALPAYLS